MKKAGLLIMFIFVIISLALISHSYGLEELEEAANTKVIKRYYSEFLNQGKIEVGDEIIHKDCMSYSNGSPWEHNGLAGFKKIVNDNHQVHYTGWTLTIEDLLASKNKVVVRYRFKGLHKKSGKKFSGEGIAIYKLVNGKIKENRYTWDTWKYHLQLGYTANPPDWAGKEMKK